MISTKVQPTEHEKSVISALDSASGVTREPLGKRRGRKTPRGPNPLAVKKGRRKFVTTTQVHGSVVSQSKVYAIQLFGSVVFVPQIMYLCITKYGNGGFMPIYVALWCGQCFAVQKTKWACFHYSLSTEMIVSPHRGSNRSMPFLLHQCFKKRRTQETDRTLSQAI